MSCSLKKEWVGNIAAIVGIVALVPITWHVIFTEKYRTVNLSWTFLKMFGAVLWLYFGIINNITPTIVVSIATLFILFIVVLGKFLKKNDEDELDENFKQKIT